MRTIVDTINVYKFSELSDKAKQRAKDLASANIGYAWADEAMSSLNTLAYHFGGVVSDYSIDWFGGSHSYAKFRMPELDKAEIAARLAELGSYNPETLKGDGECKLTGFCADDDAIDGFRIAFAEGEADCEDQYSDEQFGETCDANEYEFYENGNRLW